MINKNLLSIVLNKEIKYIETNLKNIHLNINSAIPENTIAYYTDKWNFLNIFELSYMCKQFANTEKMFIVSSYNNRGLTDMAGKAKVKWFKKDFGKDDEDGSEDTDETRYFYGTSEPEAVFKALKWILQKRINEENNE